MIRTDQDLRLMNEYRTIALDLGTRIAGILIAQKAKPALFNKAVVTAVRQFAAEAQRQRGGQAFEGPANSNAQMVGDELASSCARLEALTSKLRRGRFGRDPLVMAGDELHEALAG